MGLKTDVNSHPGQFARADLLFFRQTWSFGQHRLWLVACWLANHRVPPFLYSGGPDAVQSQSLLGPGEYGIADTAAARPNRYAEIANEEMEESHASHFLW